MTTPYRPPTAPNAPLIDLDDAIAKMQTGDLMLFHNDVYFESELIDIVTDSWFSHVGVVYRDPAPAPDEDGVYIWQTDPGVIVRDEMGHLSKWGPPRGGDQHSGAQLGRLRDAVIETSKSWSDQPFWRPMTSPPPGGRSPAEWSQFLLAQMFKLDGIPYPSDAVMPLEYLMGLDGVKNVTGTMFCSEMVAATFQMAGLLPADALPNAYAPRDFSAEPNASLPLQGVAYGGEWKIVMPST